MDERIKPWVDKKIVEYLGEPEATLSKFICEQLLEHKPPAKMLSDIALVRAPSRCFSLFLRFLC